MMEAVYTSATSVYFHETTGRAVVQLVSRRDLTADDQVCARVRPCGICGGQRDTGTGFFSEFFGFLLSVSFHRGSPYSYEGWTIGQFMAAVQRHSVTASTSSTWYKRLLGAMLQKAVVFMLAAVRTWNLYTLLFSWTGVTIQTFGLLKSV
jgi:hypothetical protein